MSKTLLPAGCYDVLPPHARQVSQLSSSLLSTFESFGYEQVSPPLIEYSESLLSGRGVALANQTFRLMDPDAHKVMGLRADMTLQIARIATSRLAEAPRPLRLSYNGLILRMKGEQLKTDRQLRQAGIELIGPATPDADAEVILVAAEALRRVGFDALTIDLNLPGIVSALLEDEKLDNDTVEKLFAAVVHKDVSTLSTIKFKHREALVKLMQTAGPAKGALAAIAKIKLPESARRQCRDLEEVVKLLGDRAGITLTVDATESRGLAYHSGIAFSMFAPGAASEIGRGGRYRIEGKFDTEATGFTLYVETLRALLPEPKRGKRVLVSMGIIDKDAVKLRAQGYITIHALSEYGSGMDEAKRLGCGFIFVNGKVKAID